MADVDGRVREWLAAFEPESNGLERTLERRRRRDRNRRVLSAGLAMVIAAGGLTGAYIAFRPGNEVVQERGFIDPPTCISEDEPGLITCEKALQRAAEEEGRAGHEVHAELSFWDSPPPDSERVRVWIVTYEDVVMLGSGPPGSAPNCIIDDWGVVIDARTGAFLVAGNMGKGRPCPSPEAVPQAVPDSAAQAMHAEDIRRSFEAEGRPAALFVLDRFCSDAGEDPWSTDCGTPISQAERQALSAAMSGLATLVFVSSDVEALGPDGWVRDLGLLIHLGPVVARGDRVAVGRNFTRQNPSCAEGEVRILKSSEKGWTEVQSEATAECSLHSNSEPDATFSSVLQPAPRLSCGSGLVRAVSVPTGAAPEAMRGYLPRWLPQGFGIAHAWGVAGEGGPLVQWADSRCREVELLVAFLPPLEEALVGPKVGSWTIVGDDTCFFGGLGAIKCMRYQTVVPEGLLALNLRAVDRNEADRIALSIPLPPLTGSE